MPEYLLFLDTEASGLPKNWELPYSAQNNWPYCVQISWIIYKKDGQKLKQESHYIIEPDVKIEKSAIKIHGITLSFLQKNGQTREEVMKILADDVLEYHPLVIGHFMEFDFHMIAVDFYRTGIENPVRKELTFCTMVATTNLVKNPVKKFFKLGELYQALFGITLKDQHNALVDANATAECFFELVKRGEISDQTIALQQKKEVTSETEHKGVGCTLPMLLIISLILLIFYYL